MVSPEFPCRRTVLCHRRGFKYRPEFLPPTCPCFGLQRLVAASDGLRRTSPLFRGLRGPQRHACDDRPRESGSLR